MNLFLSTYVNKIDRKGRMSVPAQFRKVLSKSDFDGVIVFPSPNANCIEGASMAWLEKISEKLEADDMLDAEAQEYALAVFGSATPIQFQDNGRISLPKDLLDYAGLDDEAAFVGIGKTFQIWNPDALEKAKPAARKKVGARQGKIKSGNTGTSGGGHAASTDDE